MYHLERFQEGILASVFDSLDRIQHMFWRDRQDIVDEWYCKMDALVGRVEQRLADLGKSGTKIVILSDHGFADFNYKVHLNRWLIERGYLVTKGEGKSGSLQGVDWSRSQAYAVGLNSVYLNLAGREGQGCVQPDRRDLLTNKLCDDLMGKWGKTCIEPNYDHWGADHCMHAQAVPGVLFCNQGLSHFPNPSYRDIPSLTVGAVLEASGSALPPSYSEEDERAVEERLKGLGYL
jgi:predicted AlkP superfamily phosphohydrolase/phosphomutase